MLLAEIVDVDEVAQTATLNTEDNETITVNLWFIAGYPHPLTGQQNWVYAPTNEY